MRRLELLECRRMINEACDHHREPDVFLLYQRTTPPSRNPLRRSVELAIDIAETIHRQNFIRCPRRRLALASSLPDAMAFDHEVREQIQLPERIRFDIRH